MSKKDIAGKYTFIVATAITAMLLASPVFAETTPPASPAPAAAPAAAPPSATPQAQSKTPAEDKAAEAKRFGDYKQQILTKIDDLVAKMKERRSCIQASTDREFMRACFTQSAQTAIPPASGSAPAPQSPATPPAVKK